jgi:hypothetical protein
MRGAAVALALACAGCLSLPGANGGGGGSADAASGGKDGGCDDGGCAAEPPNIAFVTSTEMPAGQIGGIDAADDICGQRALAGGYSGTFMAWLSVSGDGAYERLAATGASGWVRTDGLPFAESADDIRMGRILYPLRRDEGQNDLAIGDVSVLVATGSTATGDPSGNDCDGYTSPSGTVDVGYADGGTVQWTAATDPPPDCSTEVHLYCFQTDHKADVPAHPRTGRVAFVSHIFTMGNNIGDADAWCQGESSAHGLGSNFQALLSTSTASALSRFTLSGPWSRIDGIVLTDDFLVAKAPLDVQVDGSYISTPVWSGSLDASAQGDTMTCADWSDNTGGANGLVGEAGRSTNVSFGRSGSLPCNSPAEVFCLEE